jgi:hypothetical protein
VLPEGDQELHFIQESTLKGILPELPSVKKGRSEVATTKTPRVQAARHGHVRSIASLAKASGEIIIFLMPQLILPGVSRPDC